MIIRKLCRFGAHLAGSGLLMLAMSTIHAQDFVYVNNDVAAANTVSAFEVTVDGSGNPTGLIELVGLGSPYPTGGLGSGGGFFASNRIIVCVVGDFLYVANTGDNTISVFSINPVNGNLTLVGTPVSTGGFAGPGFVGISLGVTPDAMFLLALNAFSQDISVFDIGTTPGTPMPVAGSPFSVSATTNIDGLRVTPDGNFVAVSEPSGDVIHMLTINASGVLTPISGSPFASGPSGAVAGLDVNCRSDRLYAGNAAGSTIVDFYTIDDDTFTGTPGSLILNATFEPGAGTGSNSNIVLLSRDQRHLFVSNQISAEITVFDVSATGSLTTVVGSPFSLNSTPTFPSGLATNLAGTLLYSANFDGSVSVLEIGPSGVLTEIVGGTPSPFPTPDGTTPLSLAAYPSSICGQVPVAIDDGAAGVPGDPIAANSGETKNIDVLNNDEMLNDGVAAVTTTAPVPGGTAIVKPDFTVDFTSPLAFGGTVTFTYFITDLNGDKSNDATVTVNVDGSISVSPSGTDIPVFGGTASGVAFTAVGEFTPTGGESSVLCCKVHDARVGAGNTKKDGPTALDRVPFDIGVAMNEESDCDELPRLNPGELIIPGHFSVHTEVLNSANPDDYDFGLCVVQTDAEWLGPVSLFVNAVEVVGYAVKCKPNLGINRQPLTLGRATESPGFAKKMRAITTQCDPRGVARWSESWTVVNGQRNIGKKATKDYVSSMSGLLKDMLGAMRDDGAIVTTDPLSSDVRSLVQDAEDLFKDRRSDANDLRTAMSLLDDATLLALAPLSPGLPYVSTFRFENPKGELVSHLTALRYAVCSEVLLALVGSDLSICAMDAGVIAALPPIL